MSYSFLPGITQDPAKTPLPTGHRSFDVGGPIEIGACGGKVELWEHARGGVSLASDSLES